VPLTSTPGGTSSAVPSALAGRTDRSDPPPSRRATGVGFMRRIGNVLRKIVAVLPGVARVGDTNGSSALITSSPPADAPAPDKAISLATISDADLEQLAQQLGKATASMGNRTGEGDGATHNDADVHLRNTEAMVRGEIVSRTNSTIEANVDRVFADAAQRVANGDSPGEVASSAHRAFDNAEAALVKIRPPGARPSNEFPGTVTFFLAAGLGRLPPGDRQNVLRNLSGQDLARIAGAEIDTNKSSASTIAAIHAAREEAASRRTRLFANFQDAAGRFFERRDPDHGNSVAQTQRLAAELHQVGESLRALQAFCKARGEPLPAQSAIARDQLAEHLRHLLETTELDLAGVGTRKLEQFRANLGLLDVRLPPAVLAKAATQRLPDAESACREAAEGVLRGLVHSSPESVLKGLKDMEGRFNTLRELRHALGQEIKDADDSFKLLHTILEDAFRGLSEAERATFAQKALAPQTVALRESLYAASDAASTARLETLGNSLNTFATHLEHCISLAEDADVLGPRPQQGTAPALDQSARDAFGKVLGIHWTSDGAPMFAV
jgi:hypothetical protein